MKDRTRKKARVVPALRECKLRSLPPAPEQHRTIAPLEVLCIDPVTRQPTLVRTENYVPICAPSIAAQYNCPHQSDLRYGVIDGQPRHFCTCEFVVPSKAYMRRMGAQWYAGEDKGRASGEADAGRDAGTT